MSVELLLAMNASCGACASLGPPPSAILTLPPPPMPAFLKANGDGALDEDTPCDLQGLHGLEGLPQTCDWHGGRAGNPGVEFVELPRQVGGMGVGADDDTWFLVLVSCCAGVILLGAVLAVVLMRCRQGRGSKCVLSLDPSAMDGHGGKSSKLVGVHGEVLYPDPRALWAALTPSGGTQHFVGAPQPPPPPPIPHLQLTQRHLTAPSPTPQLPSPTLMPDLAATEPEYAMPAMALSACLSAGPPPLEPPPPPPVRVTAFAPPPAPQPLSHSQPRHHAKPKHVHVNKMATLSHASYAANLGAMIDTSSFDNSGFVDSDDQLLCGDAYAHLGYYHTVGGNRRAASHGVLGVATNSRPKVSSPTRIANPNLPPLNLHPTAPPASAGTISTHSRRSLRRAGRDAREAREAREAVREAREARHAEHRERLHHASNGSIAL